MRGIVGRFAVGLALALEQPEAMLELCDAELEVAHDVARRRAELGCGLRGGVPRRLADTRCLASPAVEHVRDRGAHLVAFDPETRADLGRELVRVLRDEGDRPDSHQAERLERSALASALGHEDESRAAACGAPAWRTWDRRSSSAPVRALPPAPARRRRGTARRRPPP